MPNYNQVQLEDYKMLLHPDSLQKAADYWNKIQTRKASAGKFLQRLLKQEDTRTWTTEDFLQALCATKRPRIFAESEVIGDGSDWTLEELGLLGAIGVAVPVVIYDNARHSNPVIHAQPFEGMLLYTAGGIIAQWPPAMETSRLGRMCAK